MPTEKEVEIGTWMLGQYKSLQRLSQARAVFLARKLFGEEHMYKNKNGNWAFNPGILEAFRELTGDAVVWSRSSQTWRARKPTDPPDSRMVR